MYTSSGGPKIPLSRSASVKVYVLEMTFEFGKFFHREYLVLRIKMRKMRTRMKMKMEQEVLLQQQQHEEMIKLQSILHTAIEAGSSDVPYHYYPPAHDSPLYKSPVHESPVYEVPIYELEGSTTRHLAQDFVNHPLEYELDGSEVHIVGSNSTVDTEVQSCELTQPQPPSEPQLVPGPGPVPESLPEPETEIQHDDLHSELPDLPKLPQLPPRPTSEAGSGRLHKKNRPKVARLSIREKSDRLYTSSTVRKSPNMQYAEDPELKQEADVLVMELSLVNVRQRQLNLLAAKAGVSPEELGDGKGDEYRELLQREMKAMSRLDEISKASAHTSKERRVKSVALC